MTAQVPTKIVLKSTTKMSLNDRFTSIQQQTRAQPTVPNIRANMAAQQQASAANRRLAQQLANRPGLGMGDFNQMQSMGMMNNNMGMMNNQMPPPPQQRSLKQRLGRVNVKARLNLEAVGRGGMQNRGRGGFQRGGSRFPRGQGQGGSFQPRGRGGMRGGGPRGGGINASPRGVRGRGRGTFRGGFNRFGGRGAGGGRGSGGRGGIRGQGPRGRGGMRGRGRGRGRGAGGDPMSREQLDNQLDEYMSKTKSYLDSELDAYMAEANP